MHIRLILLSPSYSRDIKREDITHLTLSVSFSQKGYLWLINESYKYDRISAFEEYYIVDVVPIFVLCSHEGI